MMDMYRYQIIMSSTNFISSKRKPTQHNERNFVHLLPSSYTLSTVTMLMCEFT